MQIMSGDGVVVEIPNGVAGVLTDMMDDDDDASDVVTFPQFDGDTLTRVARFYARGAVPNVEYTARQMPGWWEQMMGPFNEHDACALARAADFFDMPSLLNHATAWLGHSLRRGSASN